MSIKLTDKEMEELIKSINDTPAEIETLLGLHSKWTIPGKVKDVWVCANCGYGEGMTCSEEDDSENDANPYWSYCPHCGARMDLK